MRPSFANAKQIVREPIALLPFRFARVPGLSGRVLLTSETGEHMLLPEQAFDSLVRGQLPDDDPTAADLEAKHFIYRGDSGVAVRLLAAKLRTRKSFLRHGPSLHIFVVTLRCDHGCHYCQVSRRNQDSMAFDMSEETAKAAVERLFDSPAPSLTVEFQGGEPLLAFPRIRQIVELIRSRNAAEGRQVVFTMTSTLNHVTDEILDFLREHGFHLSTSVDGPSPLHESNRPNITHDSYARTVKGIDDARRVLGHESVAALVTLTRGSLANPEALVEEYIRLGFRSIFLRPVSPFGFARRSARRLGYSTIEFLTFYERALTHIIELNKAGTYLEETYATILLKSILTPYPTSYVDLRSPIGAGFGTLVYNFDGGVYASDEARMLREQGDESLRLGHVRDAYEKLMHSDAMQLLAAAGLAETLPGCSDCAFVPYCGPDPASSLSRRGDPIGHKAFDEHCQRHMGLFQLLFKLLGNADAKTLQILVDWVHHRGPREASA